MQPSKLTYYATLCDESTIVVLEKKIFFFADDIDDKNSALSAESLGKLQDFLMEVSSYVERLPVCLHDTKTYCQLALLASFGTPEFPDLTQAYHRDFGGNNFVITFFHFLQKQFGIHRNVLIGKCCHFYVCCTNVDLDKTGEEFKPLGLLMAIEEKTFFKILQFSHSGGEVNSNHKPLLLELRAGQFILFHHLLAHSGTFVHIVYKVLCLKINVVFLTFILNEQCLESLFFE
jgi:hypothetical protein